MKKIGRSLATILALLAVSGVAYSQVACNFTDVNPCGANSVTVWACDPSGEGNPPGNQTLTVTSFPDVKSCVYISLQTSGKRGCVNMAPVFCFSNMVLVECDGTITRTPLSGNVPQQQADPSGEPCSI